MTNSISKLPPAVQATLGFAVTALGLYEGIHAIVWSLGDLRIQLVFSTLSVLCMLSGIPPMIEGIMTMNARANKAKQPPRKGGSDAS